MGQLDDMIKALGNDFPKDIVEGIVADDTDSEDEKIKKLTEASPDMEAGAPDLAKDNPDWKLKEVERLMAEVDPMDLQRVYFNIFPDKDIFTELYVECKADPEKCEQIYDELKALSGGPGEPHLGEEDQGELDFEEEETGEEQLGEARTKKDYKKDPKQLRTKKCAKCFNEKERARKRAMKNAKRGYCKDEEK